MTAGDPAAAPAKKPDRLLWLDIARVLSAVMILGIHWLRPGYKLGLFGQSGFNLVMNYQGETDGLKFFHDIFIAGFDPSPSTWLTNIIGLLGGFGWEAVSAFIFISGFSLAISQGGKSLDPSEWVVWFRKRAARILVPFYMVALPCLAVAACAIVGLHYAHGPLASLLETKVLSQFHTSLLGVALSHIFLVDPFEPLWSPNFFVPAWWFIPAILLAYLTYPFVRAFSRISYGLPLLAVSGSITVASYIASNLNILTDESWYFIVLQESFNFSFGVVVANLWLGAGRKTMERAIGSPVLLAAAFAVFILGNLLNWTYDTRPFASMFFGPSLAVMLVVISKWLENWTHAKKLLYIDPYDLYLVHQPFAFPIALFSKIVFHSYAIFFGWFIFVAVASVAARVLTVAQRPFHPGPARIRPPVKAAARSALITDDAR